VDRRTVLILTQPLDRTSDHVILRLQKRGVDVVRFDTGWFPSEASLIASLDGDEPDTAIINSSIGKPVDLGKVASIWYRRPLDFTFSSELDPDARRFARDEALHGLGGVLRSVDCRWVNHPEKEVSAGYKPFQLASARRLGLSIPRTLITNDPEAARSFIQGPGQSYIYKTLCVPEVVSDIYDHALVFTSRLTLADIEAIDTVRFTPCLLQQFVPKAFEIRATVINGKMFAVGLHAPDPDIDDWRQVTNDLTYSVYQMPADVEERSLRLVRELGLLFAAMDFVVTQEGEHVFLELNPSGQWTWLEAATGLPMVDTLADCLAPFSAAHAAHAGRAG
jgi:ATP-grasp ribosomal peptide maturase